MKKTLILALSLAFAQFSYGQISKGALFLTGMGSINTEGGETSVSNNGTTVTSEHDSYFGGTFGIGGGYFLTENIAAGLSINFSGSKITPADTSDPLMKESGMGIGLFGRYYVPVSDNFYFHGQLGFGLSSMGGTAEKGGVTADLPDYTMLNFGIRPGFTFFPSKRLGLDFMFGNLGWSSTKMTMTAGTTTTESTSSGLDMSFDLSSISFGVHYFLF